MFQLLKGTITGVILAFSVSVNSPAFSESWPWTEGQKDTFNVYSKWAKFEGCSLHTKNGSSYDYFYFSRLMYSPNGWSIWMLINSPENYSTGMNQKLHSSNLSGEEFTKIISTLQRSPNFTNSSKCFELECTKENFTNHNDMLCEENVNHPNANLTINGKRREY